MKETNSGSASTGAAIGETFETKASVKNGTLRLILVLLSILVEFGVIFLLVYLAGQRAGWVYEVIRLISVILVLVIYGNHETSSIRMTWIILIMFLPVFGTILYFMIGFNGYTWKMRKRYEEIDKKLLPLLPANEDVEQRVKAVDGRLYGLSRYLHRNAGYPVYDNTKLTYFDDGEKGFEDQKRELAKAQKFIFMEYHAIEDAECWHEMRDILAERARAGVEVRIFYDDIGSVGFITTDFIKRTEALGMQCRVFNPFVPGLNLFLNNRDHRKITVIDGKVGYTGGYNLANEYFHRTEPYGFWKDSGIRLEGEAVNSLTVTFLEMWNAVRSSDKDDTDFTKYLVNYGKSSAGPRAGSLPSGDPGTGSGADSGTASEPGEAGRVHSRTGFVQPYADSPMDNIHVGEDMYISIAEGAKDYVWFITPYLIITDEMNHALSLAAMRGVDVRIITPGIPDKRIVYSLTRSYYNGLTRHGVRIFEFTPGFCHSKMCVSDDLIATCGTINLDYRSLYHHFENGCLYADCDGVLETKADFERTFAQCREVTEYYTSGRGSFQRFGHMLLRMFAPLM